MLRSLQTFALGLELWAQSLALILKLRDSVYVKNMLYRRLHESDLWPAVTISSGLQSRKWQLIKGPFIATQLNSTELDVELRRYKRALTWANGAIMRYGGCGIRCPR